MAITALRALASTFSFAIALGFLARCDMNSQGHAGREVRHFTKGQELLKAYRSSPNKVRVFCANCGSPLYSARDDLPGVRRLRLGTVDTPFECRHAYHAQVGSKASWETIADGLPQFQESART